MLTTPAIGFTVDGFGYISGNAGGIADMSYLGHCVRLQQSDSLTRLTGVHVSERPVVHYVLQASALSRRIRPTSACAPTFSMPP